MGRKTPLSQYTDEELFAEAARRMRAKQTHLPNPRVMRPCPKCGIEFSARELKIHKPKCEGKNENLNQ